MPHFLRSFPKLAQVVSFALFAACLLNDGYYIEGSDPRAWSSALGLLLLGWVGLESGTVAWLANPALLIAWILSIKKRYSLSLPAAIIAIVLMLSFLFESTVISSEAPTYSRITGYGAGFWLWIASAVTQIFGSAVGAKQSLIITSQENAA